MSELPPRVEEWRRSGERVEFRGHGIHLQRRAGRGAPLVLLHGFPSSSYDWRLLIPYLEGAPLIAPDFLGFGLSDKPRDHHYSLLWQADLVEDLVARFGAGGPVHLVGHDMGTSVANELMARDLDGTLPFPVASVFLFNGSMVQDAASPTLAQKLLRGPLGPVASRLSTERFFRRQFGSVFSAGHPLSADEATDQWALISAAGGMRLGHKLVGYMDERMLRAERWHGAIRDWAGQLELAWGTEDPVATGAVLAGLRRLRPNVPVTELDGLGHYPQIEDPPRLAQALRDALRRASEPSL